MSSFRITRTVRIATAGGIATAALAGCGSPPPAVETAASTTPATFVGNGACADCHAAELAAWTGSDHDLAMEAADETTVRGDFSGVSFSRAGATTTFGRDGAAFVVSEQDAAGELTDFRVTHTFGVDPLQQYLLELPGGRLQALTIAWDTRPAEQGGQRWFDLHDGEAIGPADPLHWTGLLQNWNSNCAECHSTNVVKGYDAERDAYATTWSSIDVGCESCHGPGSRHASAPADFSLALPSVARAWTFPAGIDIARREPEAPVRTEIEACASCHSRRSQLTDEHVPGEPYLDGFRPALLTDPLYHADGQIRDEVYVYGSFLQSRMHAAGVTCSDCHDPHSARLRADGNAVCARCHLPAAFDTPQHHHHAPDTAGAECTSCHMPATTYMVVDPRRDHSFRVPRPDLSVALGTPNACGDCHEQPASWAAEQVAAWYPQGRTGELHYAQALDAGRRWSADRGPLLNRFVADPAMPAIVRASALTLLGEQLDAAAFGALRTALVSGEPLLELAALDTLAGAPIESRIDLGQRFLTDAPLALRLAAAQALLPARARLSAGRQADLDAAIEDLRAAHRFAGDRPEGLLGLADLESALGRPEAAEAALRTAIERQPGYPASYGNLADLYRGQGRDGDAERVLRAGLDAVPDSAALHHALGLTLVRTGGSADALVELARAVELAPDEPFYAYVYGVGLNSLGDPAEALESLERAHGRFPGHAPTLVALATMHRDAGNRERALDYARRLLALSPADPDARGLIAELE